MSRFSKLLCGSCLVSLSAASVFPHFSDNKESSQKLDALLTRNVLIFKESSGIPGVSVAISVNGTTFWKRAFGYSDVENLTPMYTDSVMRIASISKTFCATLAGQLAESGKLDLDADIHNYLPSYPPTLWKGNPVKITARQLLCHKSGLRHYTKAEDLKDDQELEEFMQSEYYSTHRYASISEALEMFKNDTLVHEPNTKHLYTTHGFTLLSAVLEKAASQNMSSSNETSTNEKKDSKSAEFTKMLDDLILSLELHHTRREDQQPILERRVKHYTRNPPRDKNEKKKRAFGKLHNVVHVDNSYKWAGGGLLSNTDDLLHYAHHLIYSCLHNNQLICDKNKRVQLLSSATLKELWNLVSPDKPFGLGWFIERCSTLSGVVNHSLVYHTGGAVGATSILLISLPTELLSTTFHSNLKCTNNHVDRWCFSSHSSDVSKDEPIIVVTVLANLQEASGILQLAKKLEKGVRRFLVKNPDMLNCSKELHFSYEFEEELEHDKSLER